MRSWILFVTACTFAQHAFCEETVIRKLSLPFASIEQRVTYSTTESDYNHTRDQILMRLKAGVKSALVNPQDTPWLRAETTLTIGIAYEGYGIDKGRVRLRQVSAAEEALYLFEKGS